MANAHKRIVRHFRLRKKVFGTSHRPRLSIYFSNRHITVQVVDDIEGRTVASVSTTEAHLRATAKADVTNARKIGKLIAERGLAKNIRLVVFDRGGFKFHGKVKALAEAAREGGLQF